MASLSALRRLWLPFVLLSALLLSGVETSAHASNLSYHGGPIMSAARAEVIFWLPPNAHYGLPSGNTAAADQAYESRIKGFLRGLSGSAYLNILTQYIGSCSASACTAPANPGGVRLGDVLVDMTPYPQSPLQDQDVQNEIKNLINARGLSFNLNTIFLIYTAAGINECDGANGCTSTDFCAYHNEFDFNGGKVVYGFMGNANSLPGCGEGISATANQAAANQEVALTSHELFEAVTDPEPFGSALNILNPTGNTAWWDSDNLFSSQFGTEIGDKCNQIPASVPMASGPFTVQQMWSNDSVICVASFGPTVRYDIVTGSDDLRGDSSATSALIAPGGNAHQVVTLKTRDQSGWGNGSRHAVVTALRPGSIGTSATPLGAVSITLTSHSGALETSDNWNVENVEVALKEPSGRVFCGTRNGGDPLVRLTGSVPSFTLALACPPAQVTGPLFHTITFVIQTGSDDLRGDSSAVATLAGPGGAAFQSVTIKAQNQAGFGNNSTHTISATLSPARPLSAFQSVGITLTSHSGVFETDDNWNVQAVNVSLSGGGSGRAVCLANVGGNPFVRLTGSAPTVQIAARRGC